MTQACSDVAAKTSKPVAIATNFSGVDHRELAEEYTNIRGIPVLDGTIPALRAARDAFAWRDWRTRNRDVALEIKADRQQHWSTRLKSGLPMDEAEGLSLLSDYGITVPEHAVVETEAQAIAAAAKLGSPLVMKTAMPGIAHKSDVGGVILGLEGEAAIGAAYRDLADRLGSRVFLAPMIKGGVEMVLGVTHDPQFGALVLLE